MDENDLWDSIMSMRQECPLVHQSYEFVQEKVRRRCANVEVVTRHKSLSWVVVVQLVMSFHPL